MNNRPVKKVLVLCLSMLLFGSLAFAMDGYGGMNGSGHMGNHGFMNNQGTMHGPGGMNGSGHMGNPGFMHDSVTMNPAGTMMYNQGGTSPMSAAQPGMDRNR